jgi:hypothetical protein
MTGTVTAGTSLPPLPLEQWRDSKTTLHQMLQVVGKVKLARAPRRNHWWHVPLYVSARGLATGPLPNGWGNFELEFDFLDHRLTLRASDGMRNQIDLTGQSVASFSEAAMGLLESAGIRVEIPHPHPFDMGVVVPWDDNRAPAPYDREYVTRFWRILVAVEPLFQEFGGRFTGKSSPVHVFWHSMDLALTRFSGRRAPDMPGADPVTREAYSHEVVSFGFWAGDDDTPEPAFYSYTAPEPEGLRDQPLRPAAARWATVRGGSMALYPYEAFRAADDPRASLLEFLDSAYLAGATTAGWDLDALSYRPPAA